MWCSLMLFMEGLILRILYVEVESGLLNIVFFLIVVFRIFGVF